MSNKYFEEYTPEEYKQLSVALTLANAKLQDMYMMKTHSDFQILQSRITEQVNKAEALRQIKENELTLNPKVVSYLFNSPAQAQQQAQQQLQQIQNPAPVGIPALPPVVEGEQKDEAPEQGEQKADAPEEEEDEDARKTVDMLNLDMETEGYANSIEGVRKSIKEADDSLLKDYIEESQDYLMLKGLNENVRKLYNEQKNLAEAKLLENKKPASAPAPKEKKTRAYYEKKVRDKLGDVPNLGQSGMVNKDMLIEILEQNMNKAEADDFIKRGKQTKDEFKALKRRREKLDQAATPVSRAEPETPRPETSRPATKIPMLADEGKKIKTSIRPFKKKTPTQGKGLKYKKTPKKLLMVGSAHAGNNNKKMLKMLKRKK